MRRGMSAVCENIRRVAGGLLILFAVIPFIYSAINLCFLFSEYDFRFEVVDFSAFVPFTLSNVLTDVEWSFTSLLIILWCLQFVLPAFLLGSQMVKCSWSPMSYWALGFMVIIVFLGVWLMIECAFYQYYLIEGIDDCTKEEEVMPAIYGGGGLIGPFLDVFSFYMFARLTICNQERQEGMLEGWRSKLFLLVSFVFAVALSVNSLYWIWRYISS